MKDAYNTIEDIETIMAEQKKTYHRMIGGRPAINVVDITKIGDCIFDIEDRMNKLRKILENYQLEKEKDNV